MCATVKVHHKLINAISVKCLHVKQKKLACMYFRHGRINLDFFVLELAIVSVSLAYWAHIGPLVQCTTHLSGPHWTHGLITTHLFGFTLVHWFSVPLTYSVSLGSLFHCITHLFGSFGSLFQCTTHLFVSFFLVTGSLYHSPIQFFWVNFSVYHSPIRSTLVHWFRIISSLLYMNHEEYFNHRK